MSLLLAKVFAVGLCASGLFCLAGRAAARGQKGRPPARPAARAQVLFRLHCAGCHGADGRGETVKGEVLGAPDFTDAAWRADADDRRLNTSITHGVGGMPSFKEKLTPGEVAALVAYIRRFKNGPPPRAD